MPIRTIAVLVTGLLLLLLWRAGRLAAAEQALKHWSDIPVNLTLQLTSEFERAGRDPAKAAGASGGARSA